MIAGDSFTIEWQASKREELGGCDPVLLEKTIHAFALLDALAARGLQFIFKGGTSLLLRLPRIRRLSIRQVPDGFIQLLQVNVFSYERAAFFPDVANRFLYVSSA